MNFPPQLQQKIEKWASSQGISTEEFILQAITEKIELLSQQVAEEHTSQTPETNNLLPHQPTKLYRKDGILVVDGQLPENFDARCYQRFIQR
ncbi:hypothetical protein H6G27_17940 [Nostoc linckia FACHB-104]|nr:hypothetical protein [Nostoc linckia FACHB-104]